MLTVHTAKQAAHNQLKEHPQDLHEYWYDPAAKKAGFLNNMT